MTSQSATSSQAATEEQNVLFQANQYGGGSALLDAQAQAAAEVGTPEMNENPTATNTSGLSDRSGTTQSPGTDTTGAYPPDFESLDAEETLSDMNAPDDEVNESLEGQP